MVSYLAEAISDEGSNGLSACVALALLHALQLKCVTGMYL
jgi:hypothetical protein